MADEFQIEEYKPQVVFSMSNAIFATSNPNDYLEVLIAAKDASYDGVATMPF